MPFSDGAGLCVARIVGWPCAGFGGADGTDRFFGRRRLEVRRLVEREQKLVLCDGKG